MGYITPDDFPNLRQLYTAQLRYLLSAEEQIVDGLPKMIEYAADLQLKQAFESHLQETEVHVTRLEQLIESVNGVVDVKKDSILSEIADSGLDIIKESDPGSVRDAGLIATAQKIEHYEIASYGTARNWARQLGLAEHANVLQKTLDEEKHADHLLSEISDRMNPAAAAA